MFIIGEFAQAGRVSVRMLRHYDAIGLLRPAHIGAATEDCTDGVLVHAAVPVDSGPNTVLLPEIERAATIVHRGSMDAVIRTVQASARWIDANGYRSLGYNRELYIECGSEFVTELQEPVIAR